jgi:DeoR/GlpR family transcriptional regulator of sugar metabolism
VNAATSRRALGLAVRQRASVPVTQLAAEVDCSKMTIRRDLNVLARDRGIRRMRGSEVAATPYRPVGSLTSYGRSNPAGKGGSGSEILDP